MLGNGNSCVDKSKLLILIKMNQNETYKSTDFRPYPPHIIKLKPGWLLV